MTNVGGISVFGATYPADIWASFMKAALGDTPPTDFIAPDEKLWPRSQYIDEGRPGQEPVLLELLEHVHAHDHDAGDRAAGHGHDRPADRLAHDGAAGYGPDTTPRPPATHRRPYRRQPDAAARPTRPSPTRTDRRGRDDERRRARSAPARAGARHRARPAAAPPGRAARAGRARSARTRSCASSRRTRGEVRARRDAVLADERRLDDEARSVGAKADEVDKQLYSGTHELAAGAAGDAGRHRHAAAPAFRPRGPGARGDGSARDARRRARVARRRHGAASVRRSTGLRGAHRRGRGRDRRRARRGGRGLGAPSGRRARSPLLADYQRRRAQNKGAGAARLVGTTCRRAT